jgi:copper chaperone CopZ
MKKIRLKVDGMHCTSCAISIDGELEDTEGVKEAKTNYAKQETEVTFEPEKISEQKIISVIKSIDNKYDAEVSQEL